LAQVALRNDYRQESKKVSGLTLEEIDQDGAFLETFDAMHRTSRADFLRKATFGGAALLAVLAAPPPPAEAKKNETQILNFDLTFEYMQASFYTEALRVGTIRRMSPEQARWANVFGAHERAHVRIIADILGRAGVRKPFFNFRGVTEDQEKFAKTVVALEDLTTALLAGQIPRLTTPGLIAALFTLLTVEARHAAWVRHKQGFLPVATAFDEPRNLEAVGEVIKETNFVSDRALTRATAAPQFTG
jgi:hypothetical protein